MDATFPGLIFALFRIRRPQPPKVKLVYSNSQACLSSDYFVALDFWTCLEGSDDAP